MTNQTLSRTLYALSTYLILFQSETVPQRQLSSNISLIQLVSVKALTSEIRKSRRRQIAKLMNKNSNTNQSWYGCAQMIVVGLPEILYQMVRCP